MESATTTLIPIVTETTVSTETNTSNRKLF